MLSKEHEQLMRDAVERHPDNPDLQHAMKFLARARYLWTLPGKQVEAQENERLALDAFRAGMEAVTNASNDHH